MREAAPAVRRCDKLLTFAKLVAREHVIEAEFDDNLIALNRHGARNQRLRIHSAPVREGRRNAKGVLADEGGRRDLAEQTGVDQILGHDACDVGGHLLRSANLGGERRGGERQRLDHTIGNRQAQRRLGHHRTGQHNRAEQGQQSFKHGLPRLNERNEWMSNGNSLTRLAQMPASFA